MKICFVTEHFFPHVGGVEIAFKEYATRLAQQGHDVRVITSNSGGVTGEREMQNIKIYYLDCRSFFGHPILPIKKIEQHILWADVVHTTTYTAALPAVKLCNEHEKPCILMVHEVLGKKWFFVEENPLKALGFLFFEWYVINKKYNIWQAISEATRRDLLRYKIPKEKTEFIYHGIDYSVWNPEVQERNLNQFLGYKNSDKIFLYNGRPGKTKGVFLLLKAIEKVKNDLPKEFKFGFIISEKPANERATFEKLVKKYKLEDLIKIKNTLPYQELPGYRKNAFALIVPSLTEGFGFTAAEISSLKVPLITSNADSLPEVASGKVLFFKNGDADYLAKKIHLAVKNQFEIIPEKKFSWDDSVRKILNIYEELIK